MHLLLSDVNVFLHIYVNIHWALCVCECVLDSLLLSSVCFIEWCMNSWVHMWWAVCVNMGACVICMVVVRGQSWMTMLLFISFEPGFPCCCQQASSWLLCFQGFHCPRSPIWVLVLQPWFLQSSRDSHLVPHNFTYRVIFLDSHFKMWDGISLSCLGWFQTYNPPVPAPR